MSVRRILVALTVVGGSLAFASSTALAGGQKVPPGCSFAQGVMTCVTTSTTTTQLGPETTNGLWVPASTTFDGIAGSQICMAVFGQIFPGAIPSTIMIPGGAFLEVSITVSTVTQHYGMHGPVFATSSTESAATLTQVLSPGSMSCGW